MIPAIRVETDGTGLGGGVAGGGVGGGGCGWSGGTMTLRPLSKLDTGWGGWGGGRLFGWRCIAACTVVAVLSGNVSLMLGGLARC